MTQTETETVPEQDVPGRTRWGVFLAILAVPTLVVAALLALLIAWLFTDDSVDTDVKQTSCAEALAFGGAKVPTGMRGSWCGLQGGSGPRYEARFDLPRAELDAWVAASFPQGPKLRTSQCGDSQIDSCLTAGPVANERASVQIDVTYTSRTWTEVRYVAFTL
ncbi:hypothetical protein ACFUEN_16420 [Streptomyces griseorubiginosus]|uniref:Uncharacterized protein n=1 Tax=Streptomyces griseorubiginosus TaxID=67304 RepID=A0A101RVX6_9ACTN|nr:hypothetical protein [Streptomyces griseorubiginosus]KUN62718.1 hypothetical protein AQJ54_30715 [Streptomyces griseorubiginosus]